MFTKELFGKRLKQIRKNHSEKQDELAASIGVTPTQISDMENGKAGTTLEKLALICEHYNVSADYLLGLSDQP